MAPTVLPGPLVGALLGRLNWRTVVFVTQLLAHMRSAALTWVAFAPCPGRRNRLADPGNLSVARPSEYLNRTGPGAATDMASVAGERRPLCGRPLCPPSRRGGHLIFFSP